MKRQGVCVPVWLKMFEWCDGLTFFFYCLMLSPPPSMLPYESEILNILNNAISFIFHDAISVSMKYLLTFFSIMGEHDEKYDHSVTFTLAHFSVL